MIQNTWNSMSTNSNNSSSMFMDASVYQYYRIEIFIYFLVVLAGIRIAASSIYELHLIFKPGGVSTCMLA